MNYYIYNYTNKNGEQKELKLRLKSGDAIEIENLKKKSINAYLQDESMSMIVNLLRYLVHSSDSTFDFKKAQDLYDELVDSGMTMKRILVDIIYEALVVSGFLEREEWEEMKAIQEKMNKKAKELISQE